MDNFDYLNYIKNNPLLNEIKINNPNDMFQVTDEGRQAIDEMYKLEKLIEKWGGDNSDSIRNDFFEGSDKYPNTFQMYVCSSKYGESIIKDNEINKLKDVKDNLLKYWLKKGWITPIHL